LTIGGLPAGPRLRSTFYVRLRFGAAAALFVSAAFAQQQFEIGGLVGYGFYHNGSVTSSAATLQAGFTERITAGAVIGEDLYEHISGEARYLYQESHPFLSGTGFRADLAGHSHTLTYDVLFHLLDRDHRMRPFAAVGVGAKYFAATGVAPSFGSAPPAAVLVNADEWKFVGDFGAGVKFRLQRHVIVRAEIRDYVSPFPRRQIAVVGTGKIHGFLHEITPLVGVSYSF
jgi:opacity protein-like surface antigen